MLWLQHDFTFAIYPSIVIPITIFLLGLPMLEWLASYEYSYQRSQYNGLICGKSQVYV